MAKKNSLDRAGRAEAAGFPPASFCLKFLCIALAAGAGAACIRYVTGFFPVLQGMFVGIASGGAAGLFLKKAAASPGERAWLWLNILLTYTLALGILLSILHAQPFSPPLSWLKAVSRGGETEHFFGASIFSWGLYGGALSGAGWVFFNALDGIFFFFSGLIISGVTAGGAERPPGREKSCTAKTFFFLQWGIIILLFFGVSISGGVRNRLIYSGAGGRLRAREALSALEGRYAFSDGRDLLAPSGRGGSFTIEASGYDSLTLRGGPEENYFIAISKQGRYFPGRLYRGRSYERVFLKFSEDGRLLISGRRKSPGGGRTDLVMEARREEEIPPRGNKN